MKVEVEADELCELRRRVSSLECKLHCYVPGYPNIIEVFTAEHVKKLEEERDWWRDRSTRLAGLLDDARRQLNLCYSAMFPPPVPCTSTLEDLRSSAKKAGYEVQE